MPPDTGPLSANASEAVLLPTAKAQCKHRRWKHFGFTNRRRCIAFVKHAHRS